MRSHAKASSAGSNSGRGESRGFRGRLGVLTTFVLACVLACLTCGCLLSSSALAAETRLPVETFGSDGTSSSSFTFPYALAFDQGNEHLYALDQGAASIYGFDASSPGTHTELGGNFPLTAPGSEPGFVDDLAADSSSHDLYFLSEAKAFSAEPSLYAFEADGTAIGGNFPIGGYTDPCGAAVDPSGNVWVVDDATQTINEYDSSGNPIGSVSTAAQGFPCHLTFDSQANLYVTMYFGPTWRYSAASGYATATEIDASASSALTVDRSTDRLYVTHFNHVAVYDSTGAFLYEFGADVAGAEYIGIAIDEAGEEVYLSDVAHGKIQVFGAPIPLASVTTEDASEVITTTATLNGTVNPNGKQLTDCHFEYVTQAAFESTGFTDLSSGGSPACVPPAASIPPDSSGHSVSADIGGLSAGTTYRFRLAAATAEGTANGPDRVLTTAIGPPTVSAQSVEATGTSEVTLSAKINPKGAKTTYHVEYGTTASYGQSSAESASIGFGSDNSDHIVSVHIGGLTPGTAYHFRFLATNPAGTGEGPDATFSTYPTNPGLGPCSNDQLRSGFGARLPDCRAYEQATPLDKRGANIQGEVNSVEASSSGDRVSFYLNGGLPTTGGTSSLAPFMASRASGSWTSNGLLPPTVPGLEASFIGWSEDLSTSLSSAPGPGNTGSALYLRDSGSGAFQLGPVTPAGFLETVTLADFAADTSHLTFETETGFLPGAPGGVSSLYDLDHGNLTLASRIPTGSATSCDDEAGPACVPAPEGAFAGPYDWNTEFKPLAFGGASRQYYTQNTISRDGSKVFFTSRNAGQLYMREDATRTTRISASQRTTPDPNGERPAAFLAATPDGSKVFFASCEKLTDDSTAFSTGENNCTSENQGQDLYSFDTGSGELTDLTVDSNVSDPKGADLQGVLGTSEDGSYVYFAANGVLASGASLGNCRIGGSPISETCNVYLFHEGTTTFVTSLTTRDWDWAPVHNPGGRSEPSQRTSRVAANGQALLLRSEGVLYRYTTVDEELSCVSCNPTGVSGSGATLATEHSFLHVPPHANFLTRNLSADGNQVFFETPDALLPADTNGVGDVYEWEAKGSGSCESESQNGGCLYLISTGTSPDPSRFLDASADGSDAFFFTSQPLVPADHDELIDVYDASSGGGLASQHALTPPTCTGTACQANPAPPPDQTMASAAFSGPGNAHKPPAARKCPKGKRKVRSAGKVRCQKAHKQHKRHTNRGGSK